MAEAALAAAELGATPSVRVAAPPAVGAFDLRLEVGGATLVDAPELALGGGTVAIIGPNGAGKSLLLRLLHGLVRPTAGRVEHDGAPATIETRRRQSMVFQTPVLLRRSVLGNLEFVRRARGGARGGVRDGTGDGTGDGAGRCAALLERVGLAGRERSDARRLSGGERQRLALARALVTAPGVLFLDEPTASLDPASTLVVERVLAEERAAGTTIVLVTHDVAQARRLADEVVFLHRGRVLERAAAGAFLAHPSSDAARAYLDGRIVA